ncbi:MAG: DUF2490 domain-containing protein [Armatimonadetes bacterium]|nr:DUF2490 domain-containing protein [Armatimonadota bacterium]MBX3107592.1 DUF2490 domain-containing protein [Fimbriimonadaceae bacterium]
MKKRSLLVLPVLAAANAAVAQDVIEDNRTWLNLNATGKISKDWSWYGELQPRFRDNSSESDQLLFRVAAIQKISPRLSLGYGYGSITNYRPAGDIHENRLWQMVTYNPPARGPVTPNLRLRAEQRMVDGGSDVGWRLRLQARASRPIEGTKWSVFAGNEYFYNLNSTDWGALQGFDQNRLFLGLGYQVSKQAKFEFGYMNQYVRGASADRKNHVLFFTTVLSF